MNVNHYAAVVINELGQKVRGFDYLDREAAERQMEVLVARGAFRAEVWAMDMWGRPVQGETRLGVS